MTKEEILEYNKRCAEFLGADVNNILERIYIDKMKDDEMLFHNQSVNLQTYEWNGTTNVHYIPFDMLQFHSDWNWIMEVKEKIYQLNIVDEFNVNYDSVAKGHHSSILPSFKNTFESFYTKVFETEKEAVVQAINQFLIWYRNEQRA